jgi:transcription initiation factor TFIIIB Brf1 subunit/transcription initiation factor TFIIB
MDEFFSFCDEIHKKYKSEFDEISARGSSGKGEGAASSGSGTVPDYSRFLDQFDEEGDEDGSFDFNDDRSMASMGDLDADGDLLGELIGAFAEPKEKGSKETKGTEGVTFSGYREGYCTGCGGEETVINDGEMRVCTSCGMQHGDVLDETAEWRYYGTEDNKHGVDPNRCGMPNNQMLGISSLSTVVSGRGAEKYRRLSTWNGYTYRERELIKMLNTLRRKAHIYNLPESVIEKTIHIWKKISPSYVKRDTSKKSLVAACFIYALKDNGIFKTIEDICRLFEIEQKKLTRGCNEFVELMYNKDKKYIQTCATTSDTKHLCAQYAKMLEYPEEAMQMTIRVAILENKMGICTSSNPKSICVGVLYLISDHYKLGVTKKQISELCKVSEVTITNTYNKILKYKRFILPS